MRGRKIVNVPLTFFKIFLIHNGEKCCPPFVLKSNCQRSKKRKRGKKFKYLIFSQVYFFISLLELHLKQQRRRETFLKKFLALKYLRSTTQKATQFSQVSLAPLECDIFPSPVERIKQSRLCSSKALISNQMIN